MVAVLPLGEVDIQDTSTAVEAKQFAMRVVLGKEKIEDALANKQHGVPRGLLDGGQGLEAPRYLPLPPQFRSQLVRLFVPVLHPHHLQGKEEKTRSGVSSSWRWAVRSR